MAKAVFRPSELIIVPDKVMISTPAAFLEIDRLTTVEDDTAFEQEEDLYTGPTAEDMRREAEDFKVNWETERDEMIRAAKNEAEEILQSADLDSINEKKRAGEESETLLANAREEAEKIISDAKNKSQEIEAEIRRNFEDERKKALEQGREEGRSEGYTEGKTEVERLVQRTQLVLERAQDKRGEILTETEREIINLILLISRKVVKVISENQREVVVSNVIQALRKVRDKGNITIRVNLADLKLATDHKKDFIKMLEGVKTIQVVEDSSVDTGGCIVETDFGEIDARIASQLAELEAKILEVSPIKTKLKPRN